MDGLKELLRAINAYAYCQIRHEERVIAKWEQRAEILCFRMRPWLPSARVNEAYNQLQMDIEATKRELGIGGVT